MTVETTPFGLVNGGQQWNLHVVSGDLQFRSDSTSGGTPRMVIRDRGRGVGNVGIGVSSPSQRLQVQGNIHATGSITSASDIRFKLDISPLKDSLNRLLSMQAVQFRGDAESFPDKIGEGPYIGFIGQEVAEIVPEAVFTDDEGFLYIDYSRLTPVLTQALQEQNELIQSQQAAIEELLERVSRLESGFSGGVVQ